MNTLYLIFLFSQKKFNTSEFGKIKFFSQNLISKGWRQCVEGEVRLSVTICSWRP